MIKKIHEITIGDFDLMESTGKISQFKARFNVLPARFFIKKIKYLVESVIKLMNEVKTDELDLQIQKYEIDKLTNVNKLRALQLIILGQLSILPGIISAKEAIRQSRPIRRIKDYNVLIDALDQVREISGIDIKRIEDLTVLANYIELEDDKVKQSISDRLQQSTGERKKLVAIAYSYLIYLGMATTEIDRMKILHFIELKKLAVTGWMPLISVRNI